MQQIASITSQGQLTIPKSILTEMGISGSTKALIQKVGDTILIKPNVDFWSLEGSLKSDIVLTDKQLRAARDSFSKNWARND